VADEIDEVGAKAIGPDALGARIALDAATTAEAREYLRNQNNIARLQIENLQKQDEYETSHLRWRRFNDQMRGFLQIMLVAVGALIVVAIGAALWSATQADGLVIEAFSTPPSLADKGITGSVLAAKLLDRLTAMQNETQTARIASSFHNNWTSDIKVQIPDTGISFGQAIEYLNGWLGHEQHLTGELIETPDGVALTTRLGGEPGETVAGSIAGLDSLMQKSAEAVFRRAQPYRYARYLGGHPERLDEAVGVLTDLAKTGDVADREWAWSGLALSRNAEGDWKGALYAAARAHAINPNSTLADNAFLNIYDTLGQSEDELAAGQAELGHLRENGSPSFDARFMPTIEAQVRQGIAFFTGDYQTALKNDTAQVQLPDYEGSADTAPYNIALDEAMLHDARAARDELAIVPPQSPLNQIDVDYVNGLLAGQAGDWSGEIALLRKSEAQREATFHALFPRLDPFYYYRVYFWPPLAIAYARVGDGKRAEDRLRGLPDGCYACTRAHGTVAMLEKRYAAASWWFARAARMGPSLPGAYADWGQMLMTKGDFDGAVAKFEIANRKGPHFADPLEMWGEALIAKNRSDLALAKFEEANKYAPNWGRLHLKWGEALLWSGRKDEAKKQFAITAALDLTPSEKSELARMRDGHG